MDKHSELEVKFETNYTPGEVAQWLADCDVERYHKVDGFDTYYQQGENFVRHRCDGRRKVSVLTVKQRKSADQITDRHEVDVPCDESVTPADIQRFMAMTGWKPLFTIDKTSYIWHVRQGEAHVCIALYDVWPVTETKLRVPGSTASIPAKTRGPVRRFLEIEIEKDSNLPPEYAKLVLDQWVSALFADPVKRYGVVLRGPLNESLFEMYRPQPQARSCPKCNSEDPVEHYGCPDEWHTGQVSRCFP